MMHQTKCFKIIPANQPSEACLERCGNAFPVPNSAPVAEELFLTLKLLTLDCTHRNPHHHNDCKFTHTNKTRIWFYILTVERTIICISIQTYTFKIHLNCRKCVAQKTQTVYTPKAIFCYLQHTCTQYICSMEVWLSKLPIYERSYSMRTDSRK